MYDCHINAFLLEPGVILGRRMVPFTPGHAYLLEAQENPFICKGVIGLSDIIYAVLVCSMPWTEALELCRNPRKLLKMSARLGRRAVVRKYNLEDAAAAFQDYISAYMDTLEALEDPEKEKRESHTALPLSVCIAWALMERMPEADAWACPMSRALMYCTRQAETKGQEYMPEKWAKAAEALPEGPLDEGAENGS